MKISILLIGLLLLIALGNFPSSQSATTSVSTIVSFRHGPPPLVGTIGLDNPVSLGSVADELIKEAFNDNRYSIPELSVL